MWNEILFFQLVNPFILILQHDKKLSDNKEDHAFVAGEIIKHKEVIKSANAAQWLSINL